jgi:hypothetical protein
VALLAYFDREGRWLLEEWREAAEVLALELHGAAWYSSNWRIHGTLDGLTVTIEGRGRGLWGALLKWLAKGDSVDISTQLAAMGSTRISVDSHGSIPPSLVLKDKGIWE